MVTTVDLNAALAPANTPVNLTAGSTGTNTANTSVNITAGAGATNIGGGLVNILGGAGGATTGAGGGVTVTGGAATAGNSNGGNITLTPGAKFGSGVVGHILAVGLEDFADDAAAATGGVPVTGMYRTASVIKVRVA